MAALLLLTFASPAAAQGKGRGLGKSKKQQPAPPPQEPEAPPIPGTGVRHFGVWLDDASLPAPGRGWMTVSVGYWKSMFGHQWDAPSFDLGLGLARHVQLAVTAPVSRVHYTDGTLVRGLGDTYIAAKVGLIDPNVEGRSYGVAVVPILEVLSSGSVPEGGQRVHWALPVTFERRFQAFRAYGSAGYFSRGAAFASAAVEVPLSQQVTATAVVSHSRSLESDPLSDALELARSRWDVGGGVTYALTPNATVFGSVGRTVSRLDENASSLAISGGVSVGFQRQRLRR